MKLGITRWKIEPLYPNPFSPVHSALHYIHAYFLSFHFQIKTLLHVPEIFGGLWDNIGPQSHFNATQGLTIGGNIEEYNRVGHF